MTKGILQRRISFTFAAVLLIMVLSACTSGAAKDQYFKHVHTVAVPYADDVQVYLVLGVDVAYPHVFKPGLGHYTEHLVWHNMHNRSQADTAHQSNAWTSSESIVYWLSGSKNDLNGLVSLISRVFSPITLNKRFADTERDIVLREYDLRLANNLDGRIHQQLNEFVYKGNLSAHSVLGSPNDIRSISYSDAKRFHEKTHQQSNAVFVVVGDVSNREVTDAISSSGLPKLLDISDTPFKPNFNLDKSEQKRYHFEDENSVSKYYYQKIVKLADPVNFELLAFQVALLERLLDSNLPGGIAGPLRYDNFIARNFSLNLLPIDEQHLELRFEAIPDTGVTLKELDEAFKSVLSVSSNGFSQSTYERVRKRFTSYWPDWEDHEETQQWMSDYVLSRAAGLRVPLSKNEIKKLDDQVSLNEINALLKAVSATGRVATVFLNDQGE